MNGVGNYGINTTGDGSTAVGLTALYVTTTTADYNVAIGSKHVSQTQQVSRYSSGYKCYVF